MNKCIDCKHLNKELAFCRSCGAKWLNDSDGANCKYFEKVTAPTIFQQITESPEVLAESFVYEKSVSLICAGYGCDRYEYEWYWYSTILPDDKFDTKPEAIAATVEKLKELASDDYDGSRVEG